MKPISAPSPPISLYFDEDVAEAVAVALRLRGHDALTVKEAGRKGHSDPEQLQFAVSGGRTLFTHNIADFCRLHAAYMQRGEAHAGIIVSKQLPVGTIVNALLRLLSTSTRETLTNRVIWLSDRNT